MRLVQYTQKLKVLVASLFFLASFYSYSIGTAVSVSAAPGSSSAATSGDSDTNEDDCKKRPLNKNNCGIVRLIITITNILGVIAGIVIVATMIYGGILYSMAGADPAKVTAAKHKLTSGLTALLLFIFGFAILQWLVPGGLL